MADITSTPAVNAAVVGARDLPDLVDKLNKIDPALGQQITGKALAASTSPPIVIATTVVAYLSTKYGFGWSDSFCELAAFGVLSAGAYVMRYFTSHPISGFFRRTKTVPPAATLTAGVAP